MFPYLRLWKCIPFAVSELVSDFRAAQKHEEFGAHTARGFIIAPGHYCDPCTAAVLQNQRVWKGNGREHKLVDWSISARGEIYILPLLPHSRPRELP